MSKKELPEINAGSMADIAFLLLIFFLVTTTMDVDSGILKKIPQKQENQIELNKRNVLEISINKNNQLFINNKIIAISELKDLALKFIDNNGKKECDWCHGENNPNLSDHPTKAVISIEADRNANYETYVNVLDKINNAYLILRNNLSVKMYGVNYKTLETDYKKITKDKAAILIKIKSIRKKYPLLISDIENNLDMAKK